MTLDEAIAHAREEAEDKRADADWKFRHGRLNADDCISCAEEHEQLAEWLEELKELRNMTAGHLYAVAFKNGYLKAEKEVREKAIDDFAEKVKEMYAFTILEEVQLEKIAEQLKVGVDNVR